MANRWRRRAAGLTPEQVSDAVVRAVHPDARVASAGKELERVDWLADAIRKAAIPPLPPPTRPGRPRTPAPPRPLPAADIASRAAASAGRAGQVTPPEIETAMRAQGIDWVEPFSPGRPLQPFYGYGRRPRAYDYRLGRNVTTETRPDRLPFTMLQQVIDGYDIALSCLRHSINDIRSMPLMFGPAEDVNEDVGTAIKQAKKFLRKPDGQHSFVTWFAKWAYDCFAYDAACLHRQRDKAGRVIGLTVIDGKTIACESDFFGMRPTPPAPAFQQFIQGIPWDWLTTDDLIYEPQWPRSDSLYGVAPIETILLNASTDARLQLFFLEFFQAGSVPEMMLEAPEGMTDPDAIAELQETWDDFFQSNQSGRHGAYWIPNGSKPHPYKNIQQMDPRIAEYLIRRTCAAFFRVPQDMGLLQDVNKASADTQVDTQWRIGTAPDTEYFEALLNGVLQDDLQLPVAVRFDDGREKVDRLMEARAHQVYVTIGAESPDEVRRDVLGKDIDPAHPVPRLFDSDRLGPIPLSYLESVSGLIDPATFAPKPGSVKPMPFVPAYGLREMVDDHPVDTAGQHRPGGGSPATRMTGRVPTPPPADLARVTRKDGLSEAAKADLARWRRSSIMRLRDGKSTRPFTDSAIPLPVALAVWERLAAASNRAEVDAAFGKTAAPQAAGLAVRAADTGRILMIQRALTAGDPAGGCWEFPGGCADATDTDTMATACREWAEETGLGLPAGFVSGSWRSVNGVYEGFVLTVPSESALDLADRDHSLDPDGDFFESLAWCDPSVLSNNPAIRPELAADSQAVQAAVAATPMPAAKSVPDIHVHSSSTPAVHVHPQITVTPPDVHVHAPITVAPGTAPDVHVHNEPPSVYAPIRVKPARVDVAAPQVNVTPSPAPEVNVTVEAPPQARRIRSRRDPVTGEVVVDREV